MIKIIFLLIISSIDVNATIICKVPDKNYKIVDISVEDSNNYNFISNKFIHLIKNTGYYFEKIKVRVSDNYIYNLDYFIKEDTLENIERIFGGLDKEIDIEYYSKNKNEEFNCFIDCQITDKRNEKLVKKSKTDNKVKILIDKKIESIICSHNYKFFTPKDTLLRKIIITKKEPTIISNNERPEFDSMENCLLFQLNSDLFGDCIKIPKGFWLFKKISYKFVFFRYKLVKEEFLIKINKKDGSFKLV